MSTLAGSYSYCPNNFIVAIQSAKNVKVNERSNF